MISAKKKSENVIACICKEKKADYHRKRYLNILGEPSKQIANKTQEFPPTCSHILKSKISPVTVQWQLEHISPIYEVQYIKGKGTS